MTYGVFTPPLTPSSAQLGGRTGRGVGKQGEGVDFRDSAVFAMQHRFVDVRHLEDDGAERLN